MHNLEIKNGVASFAENGKKERAWHKLGQVFDGPMTIKQALELSHADYLVQARPIVALTPELEGAIKNGEMINGEDFYSQFVSGKKAIIRADTNEPLGVVSENYGIVQNEEAFKFIDTLCTGELGGETPIIETAGVLGKGERIFVTAKFPEDIVLDNKGDDRVEMNIAFTTSHDGTGAVMCMVTPVRVVCNNTLNIAMKNNAGKICFRHTSGIMSRLNLVEGENEQFAYQSLNMYEVYKNSLEERFARLKATKWSEKQLDGVLAEVLLSEANFKIYKATGNIYHNDITTNGKNLFDKVKHSVEHGVGQELGERGTGMWILNGITSYYQNDANYRSEEYKFDSIMQGAVAQKVEKAYELLAV